ncbi:MAG: phosphoribosylformylglycinamidine cyclo-ligase [Bacillota bacterium]|jgi:phosphoribosylformylglycinamidine cyclo-ligase|nr:phosphoribosylformylglycinamidine cyclo-ligase [Bacillota bacterium]HHU43551.1 phosphoribosylformylglycinamidine cyclo-ligase [Clostridiales bacterium]
MIDYKSAGVDVEAGYKAVQLMKEHVKKTFDKGMIGDIGGFGGCYALDDKPDGDVLVSGTDGVGTKLKYAFISQKHDTIGIDAVAMCANDIICQGAKPLFFLDYIAIPKLEPEKVALIVKGVAEGCIQAGCVLLGGETAEMPGFYREGEYDIAGFCVGIVKKNKIIDGKDIQEGNIIIGLESSGIHSNGYSLVRKLYGEYIETLSTYDQELEAKPIDLFLTPTRIYVKSILSLIESVKVNGISHITGGGFLENIPRMMPKGLGAEIDTKSYQVPRVFKALQKKANLPDIKAYNTFNMGIGMAIAIDEKYQKDALKILSDNGEKPHVIGRVVKREGVKLC